MNQHFASRIAVTAAWLLALVAPLVHAQVCEPAPQPSGLFGNVSASGPASAAEPVVACTTLTAYPSLNRNTAFFAESDTGDAVLEVFFVNEPVRPDLAASWPFPARSFDNWRDTLALSDVQGLDTRLRRPLRSTDAAVLLTSDFWYYSKIEPDPMRWLKTISSYHFGVCAKGYPKQGTHWVNVSITDLGNHGSPACSAPASRFFER